MLTKICISNKLPGEAEAAGPETTLREMPGYEFMGFRIRQTWVGTLIFPFALCASHRGRATYLKKRVSLLNKIVVRIMSIRICNLCNNLPNTWYIQVFNKLALLILLTNNPLGKMSNNFSTTCFIGDGKEENCILGDCDISSQ